MRVLVNYGTSGGHSSPIRSRHLAEALAAQPGFEVEIATGWEPGPAIERFDPDLVYGRRMRSASSFRQRAAIVVDEHGDRASELLQRPWSRARRWQAFVRTRLDQRRLYPQIDGFTVVSEALARRLRRYGRPVELIPGGVDLERFSPREAPPRDRIRILYSGSFRRYQGVPILLDAFEILRRAGEPFELELLGDAGELASRAASIPGVILSGHVPHDSVPEYLGRADVLVLPRPDSRTARFAFAGKLAEYLAMGKAVVATDVGDHGHMVTDMETGMLVRAGSARALADGLLRMKDPGVRARLGREARRFAEVNLSWEHAGRTLAGFLRSVRRAVPADRRR